MLHHAHQATALKVNPNSSVILTKSQSSESKNVRIYGWKKPCDPSLGFYKRNILFALWLRRQGLLSDRGHPARLPFLPLKWGKGLPRVGEQHTWKVALSFPSHAYAHKHSRAQTRSELEAGSGCESWSPPPEVLSTLVFVWIGTLGSYTPYFSLYFLCSRSAFL